MGDPGADQRKVTRRVRGPTDAVELLRRPKHVEARREVREVAEHRRRTRAEEDDRHAEGGSLSPTDHGDDDAEHPHERDERSRPEAGQRPTDADPHQRDEMPGAAPASEAVQEQRANEQLGRVLLDPKRVLDRIQPAKT